MSQSAPSITAESYIDFDIDAIETWVIARCAQRHSENANIAAANANLQAITVMNPRIQNDERQSYIQTLRSRPASRLAPLAPTGVRLFQAASIRFQVSESRRLRQSLNSVPEIHLLISFIRQSSDQIDTLVTTYAYTSLATANWACLYLVAWYKHHFPKPPTAYPHYIPHHSITDKGELILSVTKPPQDASDELASRSENELPSYVFKTFRIPLAVIGEQHLGSVVYITHQTRTVVSQHAIEETERTESAIGEAHTTFEGAVKACEEGIYGFEEASLGGMESDILMPGETVTVVWQGKETPDERSPMLRFKIMFEAVNVRRESTV
ncbi:MAG: hypothetical protein Q9165_004463 [Trypethelium subeluteriae]